MVEDHRGLWRAVECERALQNVEGHCKAVSYGSRMALPNPAFDTTIPRWRPGTPAAGWGFYPIALALFWRLWRESAKTATQGRDSTKRACVPCVKKVVSPCHATMYPSNAPKMAQNGLELLHNGYKQCSSLRLYPKLCGSKSNSEATHATCNPSYTPNFCGIHPMKMRQPDTGPPYSCTLGRGPARVHYLFWPKSAKTRGRYRMRQLGGF